MLIKYFKGEPNKYVLVYRNGRVVRHGTGKTFWYTPYNTTLAAVPVMTRDTAFIFNEVTANYQEVSIQGQVTYRISDPMKTTELLDFSIHPANKKYVSEDPGLLDQRIINTAQSYARTAVNGRDLEQALRDVKSIEKEVFEKIARDDKLCDYGIEIKNVFITAIKATPEMQKALEADYRELIQKRADQAIYDRRSAAQKEEDKLRKDEMQTDVDLENKRKGLVDTQARNNLTLAEADAKAEEMRLNPYGEMPPQALVALALKQWAANAGTIRNLNISPDLLGQLTQWIGKGTIEKRMDA